MVFPYLESNERKFHDLEIIDFSMVIGTSVYLWTFQSAVYQRYTLICRPFKWYFKGILFEKVFVTYSPSISVAEL